VGEIQTIQPLIQQLKEKFVHEKLLLTVSTQTGMELARAQLSSAADIAWCPFDHPDSVRDFIRTVNPKMLLLTETELWPNMLKYCHENRIPVAIVNGRLSEKHFARYRKAASWLKPYLEPIRLAAVQSQEDAQRYTVLGIRPDHIEVTGNIKFDGAPTPPAAEELQRLKRQLAITSDSKVVVFGSTRPGDEQLAYTCWEILRNEFPALIVLIVPRHLTRIDDAVEPFQSVPFQKYSDLEMQDGKTNTPSSIIFIDQLGLLRTLYALAHVAVIGGSWFPGVEGHNPIEPAALGIPTVFGPYMKNFKAAAEKLTTNQGATRVLTPETLPAALSVLLNSDDVRSQMGDTAKQIIKSNQGATDKTLQLIATLFEPNSQP
jgi:3-deoxy-D-manno-octulosonic-acid transferase